LKNRVTVSIDGEDYVVIADEDEAYVRKTAEIVSSRISDVRQDKSISKVTAMAFALLSLSDSYMKALEASDNLRAQLKGYLEDSTRLRAELNEARRELNRLKTVRPRS
jgi:cell division protein ZapA